MLSLIIFQVSANASQKPGLSGYPGGCQPECPVTPASKCCIQGEPHHEKTCLC